jgi:hypothetical protein
VNVLVDLNVLLDVFLNRTPWVTDSAAVLAANHSARTAQGSATHETMNGSDD